MSERLLRLKRYLEESPMRRVQDIADELEISRTKVYALRDQFQFTYGFSLEDNNSNPDIPRGYLSLPKSYQAKEISLLPAEIETLKIAVEQMDVITPLAKQALEALTSHTPIESTVKDSTSTIHIPLSDDFDQSIFGKVTKAILKRKPAQVTYLNAQGITKDYEFYSFVLIPSGQHMHLVGMTKTSMDAGFNSINRLRLDQIQKFTLGQGQFPKPDFDLKDYIDNHFGPFAGTGESLSIKVQFSKEKAQYIRRTKRHPSQVVTTNDDGSVIWSIDAPISEYLVGWIVGYGPHAKVLEPLALRDSVVTLAKDVTDANLS